jgi:hypothetical protein
MNKTRAKVPIMKRVTMMMMRQREREREREKMTRKVTETKARQNGSAFLSSDWVTIGCDARGKSLGLVARC